MILNEKTCIDLKIEYNPNIEDHIITLTRHTWETGETVKLYYSTLHQDCTKPRNKRD